MRTAVMTDTNSGITVTEGGDRGIFVLPMPVIIEETCYMEGIDITNEQLYQAMLSDKNLSSSQPSSDDVMNLWDHILDEGYDEIIYVPMSSGLSGSCHNAIRLALHYDSKVQVADNHWISVTLRESVFDAKALADQRRSAMEIKKDRLRIGTAGTLEDEKDIQRWMDLVLSAFPQIPVYYTPLSCSIACHVGVNALGIGVSVITERE